MSHDNHVTLCDQLPSLARTLGLRCTALRSKTFGHPDPYLKLQLTNDRGSPKLPHHGQRAVTEVIRDTVYPTWNQVCKPFLAGCVTDSNAWERERNSRKIRDPSLHKGSIGLVVQVSG